MVAHMLYYMATENHVVSSSRSRNVLHVHRIVPIEDAELIRFEPVYWHSWIITELKRPIPTELLPPYGFQYSARDSMALQ
jgi:hypothetical protein